MALLWGHWEHPGPHSVMLAGGPTSCLPAALPILQVRKMPEGCTTLPTAGTWRARGLWGFCPSFRKSALATGQGAHCPPVCLPGLCEAWWPPKLYLQGPGTGLPPCCKQAWPWLWEHQLVSGLRGTWLLCSDEEGFHVSHGCTGHAGPQGLGPVKEALPPLLATRSQLLTYF